MLGFIGIIGTMIESTLERKISWEKIVEENFNRIIQTELFINRVARARLDKTYKLEQNIFSSLIDEQLQLFYFKNDCIILKSKYPKSFEFLASLTFEKKETNKEIDYENISQNLDMAFFSTSYLFFPKVYQYWVNLKSVNEYTRYQACVNTLASIGYVWEDKLETFVPSGSPKRKYEKFFNKQIEKQKLKNI